MTRLPACLFAVVALWLAAAARADEPLHQQIDRLIEAKANGKTPSKLTDDAEFVRRVYLDLAGRIPTVEEAHAFSADQAADKRGKLIDKLLAAPEYAERMAAAFHVMFMERLGDHADWQKYLRASFSANKPWDQMSRELLRADPLGTERGASFFIAKRLENFGQNPVDYPALTRDVGRLFLGLDLQCAQCHNHMFIKDYKQHDFQGLFAFFQNAYLADPKAMVVGEKLTTKKIEFVSVFGKAKRETGPRVPGLEEIDIPVLKKGEEFTHKPDPKTKAPGVPAFSPLARLAEQLPAAENPAFARNMANRLWYVLMGRGLVHPLDLSHAANPPSHPELLDLLAREFTARKFDMKFLLREIALSATYQRSSVLPDGQDKFEPTTFLTAHEKRLGAEQLAASVLIATGEKARLDGKPPAKATFEGRFVKAFSNPPREPEEDFAPSLASALFVSNDDTVLALLLSRPGNLVERLLKLNDEQLIDEAYLAVLTRQPGADEKKEAAAYLAKNKERREKAVGNLVWALLASTEFCLNH